MPKKEFTKSNLVHVNTDRLDKYFERTTDKKFQVTHKINKQIEYEKIDMMKVTGKLFNIVFCRNVLIYYDLDLHE